MGRPGVGGHSASGGGHSVSGGGHHISSNGGRGGSGTHTRPGVGSGSGGHTSSFGGSNVGHSGAPGNNHYGHQSHPSHYGHNHYGHTPPPPPPPHHHHHHHHGWYGYNRPHYGYSSGYGYSRRTSRGSCAGLFISLALVIAIIILVNRFMGSNTASNYNNNNSSYSSSSGATYNNNNSNAAPVMVAENKREKLETDGSFNFDCVDDRVGWFDDEEALENELKSFWEATGVQPYILIKEYDASLTTEAQKEEWAIDYYENNLLSDTFLYVYFDEDNTSAGYDETVGYMYQASSDMVKSVMDAEAVQIFWEYLDYYWMLEYLSTDDVFSMTFNSTASVIMGNQSLDPGVALAQAQANAAQEEAEVARGEALAAQAQAEAARAEAEAARAEAANRGTKIVKTILIVLLVIVGVVLLVLGGLAVAAIVVYRRSQKREYDERMLNTPLTKEATYDEVPNSTQNSAYSHPLNEKSTVGMSASTRGVSGNVTAGNRDNQDT